MLVGVRFSRQEQHLNTILFVMGDTRLRKCMVCGLSDGHTLINCPNKCTFCGEAVNRCACLNNSLVSGVLASETPEKTTLSSKGKAGTDDG